uniref:Uncharacterized protein n=1 Tax=viral metagenome TaxID=1070528 RepID=A0A6C0E957_9ZZZZ
MASTDTTTQGNRPQPHLNNELICADLNKMLPKLNVTLPLSKDDLSIFEANFKNIITRLSEHMRYFSNYTQACYEFTPIFKGLLIVLKPILIESDTNLLFKYYPETVTKCRNFLANFTTYMRQPWLGILFSSDLYGSRADLYYTQSNPSVCGPIMNAFFYQLYCHDLHGAEDIYTDVLDTVNLIAEKYPKFLLTVDSDGNYPFQNITYIHNLFPYYTPYSDKITYEHMMNNRSAIWRINPKVNPNNYDWELAKSRQIYGYCNDTIVDFVRKLAVAAHRPIDNDNVVLHDPFVGVGHNLIYFMDKVTDVTPEHKSENKFLKEYWIPRLINTCKWVYADARYRRHTWTSIQNSTSGEVDLNSFKINNQDVMTLLNLTPEQTQIFLECCKS